MKKARPRVGGAVSDRGIRCLEGVRHSRWHGAVSSALVSRAMPAGGWPSSPGGGSKPSPRFFAVGDARSRCAARSGAGVKPPPGELAGVPWLARHPGCGRPDATAFSQQLAGGRRSLDSGAIRANDGQFTAASSGPGRMRRALGRLQTVARRAPLRRVRNPQRNVGRTHERPPAREQLRGVQARGLKHPGAAGSAGRQLRREFWKSKSHWNRSSSS